MSSLDLKYVVRELRQLVNGKVRKIYQHGKKQFLLEFFVPGSGGIWLYIDQSRAFLTEHKLPSPPTPPSFCMFLRKHLMGKTLTGVTQYLFDRILELKFGDVFLIIELVPPGNVILCDSSYSIIMPLEIQRWKDREIRSRVTYRHPPLQKDPFLLSLEELQGLLGKSEKSLGAFLASTLGFGGIYAKEVCLRGELDERMKCGDVRLEGASHLHTALEQLLKEKSPTKYEDFVSPFELKTRKEGKRFQSLSEACDDFVFDVLEKIQEESPVKEERGRIERIIESQEKATEDLAKKKDERKEIADLIYSNYSLVQGVIDGIRKAKASGMAWIEIKSKIKGEATEEAQAIKELREDEGMVIVELDGRQVELDFRVGVEENAARYYEGSKEARSKLAGALEAKVQKEKELERVEDFVPEVREVKKKLRRKWYEKFKWFTSSDGFLVIGGKDAKQNELIYSKYINPGDKVFHADIPGAALVVIQSDGREVSEEAKREASEFSAASSKAWGKGLGAIDVYCIDPVQISKSPPSGLALAKGAFFVSGERSWYRNTEVKLSIGVAFSDGEVRVLTGPVMSLRRNASYFITIKPGLKKSLELAKSIKTKLLLRASVEDKPLLEDVSLEEIQSNIPSGMGEIVEYG